MKNDELSKIKLLMNYEICKLYINTCASARNISEVTGVSPATVKRAIKSFSEKKKDYLGILPDMFTEEDIEKIDAKVNEVSSYNIKTTKWSDKEISMETYGDDIEKIKTYKKAIDETTKKVTDDDITKIKNLRIMGYSYRKIKEVTGFALSTINSVLEKQEVNKKNGL